jgi:hypothetical protein
VKSSKRSLKESASRGVFAGLLAIIILTYFVPSAAAESLNSWTSTTMYPSYVYGQSCVTSSGYIYCVGGVAGTSPPTTSVYYTTLTSSGVGSWMSTTSYPTSIDLESCVAQSGYIYCVGGNTGGLPSPTDAVYYAPLSASGVGAWTSTTSYPSSIESQSCVAESAYIYCIGGNPVNPDSPTDAVYYAPLSASGVGAWVSTTSYSVAIQNQSCVGESVYVYCVGGITAPYESYTSAVYYAPLTSSGVGTWTSTTSYPANIYAQSCVIDSGYVYCIAGASPPSSNSAVYYAPLTASGVGAWVSTTSYPFPIIYQSCASDSGYIYCVAGATESISAPSSYFTRVNLPTASGVPEFPGGVPISFAVVAVLVPLLMLIRRHR